MPTTLDRVGSAVVIRLGPELTADTLSEPKTLLREALRGDGLQLILDAAAVQLVDSAGLELLLWLKDEAEARGGGVRIAGLGGTPRKVFELTRLDRAFDLFPSTTAAARSFA